MNPILIPCSGCTEPKDDQAFSTSQLKKKAGPRCKVCIASKIPILQGPVPAVLAGFRQCSSDKKWLHASKFACAGHAFCIYHEEHQNRHNRSAASGACRVKDVFKTYHHTCEIPLQAYIEAGVAHSRNAWVTRQDVQAASDAWDARSILHDIDTQWGSMPLGGAYKDSNHYFGPGEYDYF